jgi:hypothetical protein
MLPPPIFKSLSSIVCLLSLLVLVVPASGQNCEGYFPFQDGRETEYESFDRKNKSSGVTQYQVRKSDKPNAMQVKATMTDSKGKETTSMDYEVFCEGDAMRISMDAFMPSEVMAANSSYEMQVSESFLDMPNNLQVGQSLPEATMTVESFMSGTKVNTITIRLYNRKVVGQEKITMPAGTFDCFKITYDFEFNTKTMVGISIKGELQETQWVSKPVGMVRSETIRKGKLFGSTVLRAVK